jgi:hypothetical protein
MGAKSIGFSREKGLDQDSFSGYGSIPMTPTNNPLLVLNQGRSIFSANNSLQEVLTPVTNNGRRQSRPETYGLVPNLNLDQMVLNSAS